MKISAFSKTYEGTKVLDFPGMELQPGKIYAIIGANGSGKSTFAKILTGDQYTRLQKIGPFIGKRLRNVTHAQFQWKTDHIPRAPLHRDGVFTLSSIFFLHFRPFPLQFFGGGLAAVIIQNQDRSGGTSDIFDAFCQLHGAGGAF